MKGLLHPAFAIIIGLILSSCKEAGTEKPQEIEEQNPAGQSGIPDIMPFIITDSGLIVFWESAFNVAELNLIVSRDNIEEWWSDVKACTGLDSDPPIVRIHDDIGVICPNTPEDADAAYCISIGNIVVVNTYMTHSRPLWDVKRVWKHEFIHHLLEMNGFVEGRQHQPEEFWNCD